MSATGCNPLPVRRAVLDAADVLASAEQWATKSRGGDSAPTRHGVGGAEVAKVAKAAAARAVPTTDGTISTFEVRMRSPAPASLVARNPMCERPQPYMCQVRMLFSDFGLFSLPLRLSEAELSACAKVVLPEEAEHLGKLSFAQAAALRVEVAAVCSRGCILYPYISQWLSLAQFCELLTRIASQTFSQPPYGERLRGTAERFGAFCALLRRQHRLKTAGTGVSPFQGEMPTSGLLATSEVRHFKVDEAWHALRGHAPLLDRVFTHYCLYRNAAEAARPLVDEGAGGTTRLSLESWVLLTQAHCMQHVHCMCMCLYTACALHAHCMHTTRAYSLESWLHCCLHRSANWRASGWACRSFSTPWTIRWHRVPTMAPPPPPTPTRRSRATASTRARPKGARRATRPGRVSGVSLRSPSQDEMAAALRPRYASCARRCAAVRSLTISKA